MESVQKLLRSINEYVRPVTFPVSVRLAAKGDSLPKKAKRPMVDVGHKVSLCQGVALCRRYGWTVCFSEDDHACPLSVVMLGFRLPDEMLNGEMAYPAYVGSLEAGANMEKLMSFLPIGTFEQIVFTPLHKETQKPDLVLIYGNAAQISRLVQAANYKTGLGIAGKAFGRLACSAYIAKPYLEKECSMVVPGGGERIFAHTQDDELVFSVPAEKFDDIAQGLEETHKRGVSRYPVTFSGLLAEPGFPSKYWDLVAKKE